VLACRMARLWSGGANIASADRALNVYSSPAETKR
jgi:hypothetical protein